MILTGALVNAAAVFVCGIVGTLAKKGIPQRFSDLVMVCLGIFTLYIGFDSAIGTKHSLLVVICLVAGALLGELIDLDKRFHHLGERVQKRFAKNGGKMGEAFVVTTLLFCIGSLAIMGSLQNGLKGDPSLLIAKAFIDGTFSLFYASSMGIGTCLAAFPVLIYEGGISILASFLSPYLSAPVVTEMSAVGGLLLLALGLDMLGIKKIKVANMIPAMFLPILFMLFL